MGEILIHVLGLGCTFFFIVSLLPNEGQRQGFEGPSWFLGFWALVYLVTVYFLFEDILNF